MSNIELNSTSITEKDASSEGVHWRYLDNVMPLFNPIVFDEIRLKEESLISGEAGAGRGNTFFVNFDNYPLVLRHYRRGGLARRLSNRRYIFTGLSRTRAMREFDILQHMHDLQLPVPKPFACRVIQHGASYEASLVTHRLEGHTLAHILVSATVSDEQWISIGRTIARFHQQGVYHADLNAHNILISDDSGVAVIDFDRARIRTAPVNPSCEKWCVANMSRLQRSLYKVMKQELHKVVAPGDESATTRVTGTNAELQQVNDGFTLLRSSWISCLS